MGRVCRASLIVVGLLLVAGAQNIEHATTVDQCRADQKLWLAKLERGSQGGPLPNYLTLDAWVREMNQCWDVDPDNTVRYANVMTEADATQILRLEHFLARHGLYDKFIEEDQAGKR